MSAAPWGMAPMQKRTREEEGELGARGRTGVCRRRSSALLRLFAHAVNRVLADLGDDALGAVQDLGLVRRRVPHFSLVLARFRIGHDGRLRIAVLAVVDAVVDAEVHAGVHFDDLLVRLRLRAAVGLLGAGVVVRPGVGSRLPLVGAVARAGISGFGRTGDEQNGRDGQERVAHGVLLRQRG